MLGWLYGRSAPPTTTAPGGVVAVGVAAALEVVAPDGATGSAARAAKATGGGPTIVMVSTVVVVVLALVTARSPSVVAGTGTAVPIIGAMAAGAVVGALLEGGSVSAAARVGGAIGRGREGREPLGSTEGGLKGSLKGRSNPPSVAEVRGEHGLVGLPRFAGALALVDEHECEILTKDILEGVVHTAGEQVVDSRGEDGGAHVQLRRPVTTSSLAPLDCSGLAGQCVVGEIFHARRGLHVRGPSSGRATRGGGLAAEESTKTGGKVVVSRATACVIAAIAIVAV